MIYPREIDKKIEPYLQKKEILLIKGPRQTGKTTLLKKLQTKLKEKGKNTKFITFEKKADLKLFEKDIEIFKKLYVDKYDAVFLDEFQYAESGGQKLKYLFDATGKKFIVSGSSSLKLSVQAGKYLSGRFFPFYLFQLSFLEFLHWRDEELFEILPIMSKKSINNEELNNRLSEKFEEYLLYGGYPRVVLAKKNQEKELMLSSIFEDYLVKDVDVFLQTEEEIKKLASLLSLQIGNLISYDELSSLAGINFLSLKENLQFLEETYLVNRVKPYFKNKRREIVKNPKVYFFDLGLRNFLIKNFNPLSIRNDMGAMLENFVWSELYKQSPLGEIKFWRTKSGAEVDFIIERKGEILPIEVKNKTKGDLVIGKSMISFLEKNQPKKAIMATFNQWGKRKVNETTVVFQPAWSLRLQAKSS